MEDETHFDSDKNRNQYVRGVFIFVSVIFLISILLCAVFYFVPELTNYTYNNGIFFYVTLGLFLLVYLLLYILDIARRNPPIHYFSLVIFTLLFGLMWATLAAFCALPEILMALVLLFLAALTIVVWASVGLVNVKHWGLYIAVALVMLVAVIILLAVKCGLGHCKDRAANSTNNDQNSPAKSHIRSFGKYHKKPIANDNKNYNDNDNKNDKQDDKKNKRDLKKAKQAIREDNGNGTNVQKVGKNRHHHEQPRQGRRHGKTRKGKRLRKTTTTTPFPNTTTPEYDRGEDKYNSVGSIFVMLFLTLLVGMYMVCFIQRMVADRYCCPIEPNEYIFGALTLYTDFLGLPVDAMYAMGCCYSVETE